MGVSFGGVSYHHGDPTASNSAPAASSSLAAAGMSSSPAQPVAAGGTSALSPTVPLTYALQQMRDGRKDLATIRMELAEMASERVTRGGGGGRKGGGGGRKGGGTHNSDNLFWSCLLHVQNRSRDYVMLFQLYITRFFGRFSIESSVLIVFGQLMDLQNGADPDFEKAVRKIGTTGRKGMYAMLYLNRSNSTPKLGVRYSSSRSMGLL